MLTKPFLWKTQKTAKIQKSIFVIFPVTVAHLSTQTHLHAYKQTNSSPCEDGKNTPKLIYNIPDLF